MSFNAILKNKILAKISEFTVVNPLYKLYTSGLQCTYYATLCNDVVVNSAYIMAKS